MIIASGGSAIVIGTAVGGAERTPTAERGRRSAGVPFESGSALSVAVRAHLRVGDRRLGLPGRTRERAATDSQARLPDEMDLAEMAIWQPPRDIAALASGCRGQGRGLRLREVIVPEIAVFHNVRRSGRMGSNA